MKLISAAVLAATYLAFSGCVSVAMHAQSGRPASPRPASGTTDDGLEGTWINSWGTPLERPAILNGKASFTDEEVAALRQRSKVIFSKAESDAPIGDSFLIGVLIGPDVFKNPDSTNNALDVDIPDIDNRTSYLAGAKEDRLVEQATTSIEAYQLYLRGRALVDRRGANVPIGLGLLRKAVELDPGYSQAWAAVADALTVLAYSGTARGSESKSEAIAAVKRSIDLDPTSATGHTALACATLL